MKQYDSQSVTEFLNHFLMRKKDIDNIKCNSPEIFKKTLYSNIIDALSKSAFPEIDKINERFIEVVSQFGDWEETHR